MLLLSKDLETAEYWAKKHGLTEGEWAYVDSPDILVGMKDIPMVIFPEITGRNDIRKIFKIAKDEKIRPAFSSIFDPQKYNFDEPNFSPLEPNFFDSFQVGLAIQNTAHRIIFVTGKDIEVGKLKGIQGKCLGLTKPIYVKTICGTIYIGKHDPLNIKCPEETINY